MTGSIPRGLLAGAFLLALSGWASGAPSRHPPLWWKSEEIIKELGLTADQSARIDKIFQAVRPELRQEYDELDRLEAKLSRLIEGDTLDEAGLARQIDRVETARANANKTRSLMLWRMRQVLTADQRVRLKALQAKLERRQLSADPPRQSPSGSKPESEPHKRPNF
jgi:Spy/CpxP family protein refolding chaperone